MRYYKALVNLSYICRIGWRERRLLSLLDLLFCVPLRHWNQSRYLKYSLRRLWTLRAFLTTQRSCGAFDGLCHDVCGAYDHDGVIRASKSQPERRCCTSMNYFSGSERCRAVGLRLTVRPMAPPRGLRKCAFGAMWAFFLEGPYMGVGRSLEVSDE